MGKADLYVTTMVIVMASCQSRNPSPAPHSTESNPPVDASASASKRFPDRWLGQWNGPEGTYLLLSSEQGKYRVKIQSLDGPATYEGIAVGDHIEFKREGRTESIGAGSGEQTGMKWLLDKKNCLIIKTGEGFCRD